MEYVLPLILFAIPVVAAVLDSKVRKKAGEKQVKAAPIDWTSLDKTAEAQDLEAQDAAPTPSEEGQRTITENREVAVDKPVEAAAEKSFKIDRRKLIIYSEILKPKFDG